MSRKLTKRVPVSAVAEIRFGLYAIPEKKGNVAYLQARQFTDEGRFIPGKSEGILMDKRSQGHLLEPGDVLFVGKGNKIFSWCFSHHQPTVASSIFFILRPKRELILPDYLSTMLNSPQSRISFQQIGGGTNILSIRKSELAAFEIPLPDIEHQERIVSITQLQEREIALSEEIIIKKKAIYRTVISDLLK